MEIENQAQSSETLPVTVTQPKRVRLWPIWLLIILIIAAMAGLSALAWFKLQTLNVYDTRLSHLEENKSSQSSQLKATEGRLSQSLSELKSTQQQLQKSSSAFSKQIAYNSRQLAQVGGSSRTDWLLAEAEYLLRLANQRLNMERDYKGAEAILQTADAVLAETDDQGLYEVRKQLAKEILALQAVNQIDYEGIYLQLEALINLVEELNQHAFYKKDHIESPDLSKVIHESSGQESNWQQVWSSTKEELGALLDQLIIIRRMDEPVAPLLAPDQVYYLQQNLRLMLEQAELALLDRNQAIYERSLKKALNWVDRYLINPTSNKQLIISNLEKLSQQSIAPSLPDISGSLKLLKDRVELLYRQHKLASPEKAEG